MHILPLELVFVLRLALCLLMTNAYDAQNILVLRDIEYATNNFLCVSSVRKGTLVNLAPASTKTEFFRLKEHTVGSY